MTDVNANASGSRRLALWAGLAFAVLAALLLLRAQWVLRGLGELLVQDGEPTISDVVVVLRGDEDYSRAATAARLFNQGFAHKAFVSSAVRDKAAIGMAKLGVKLPKEQDLIRSVLMQLGVPAEAIVLDGNEPGGGTLGEARRIRAMAEAEGWQRILVVTSWFHTRRAAAILRSVFQGSGREVQVVRSQDEAVGPDNWWKFRYEAVNVLLEYAKWAVWLATPAGDIEFSDNPGLKPLEVAAQGR